MDVKQTDLAWLAGFLDGEGTIGISRTNHKNQKTPYLRPLVQAPNTDRKAIDEMVRIIELVTGKKPSVCECNKGNENWSKAWRVKVSTQWELLLLIPAIIPYLILKKRQAELSLEFCKRKYARSTKHWYQDKDLDEAGYMECLALNARGKKQREVAKEFLTQLKLVSEN